MTFYFMGGEMTSFIPSDSNSYETTTSYDAGFSRCSIVSNKNGSSSGYIETPDFSAPDDFWFHGEIARGTVAATTATMLEFRTATTAVFRVRSTNTSYQMQRWTGAAWADMGSAVTATTDSVQEIDIAIVGNDASGTATFYLAGTERTTATADLTTVVGVKTFRSYGIDTAAGHHLSQCIIADEPTIGMRLATYYPNAAGATGDWTGDYTSVDETVFSDADYIYSATNGQIELFTTTGPALTGYTVRAVGVYARSKRGAAGPANLQLAIRVNGNNYFSASKAQSVGYSAYGNIWSQNPDTSADWLNAAATGLQPGVKAVT